jgi:outer membrane lipoprotein-sorting protein
MLVLQGSGGGHATTRFYFDKTSGLLARLVRYTDTPAGPSPTRYDYSDYRDVAGVKMPYRWVMTWLGGRATIELNQIQVNVPIDSAKFAKPAAPAATR